MPQDGQMVSGSSSSPAWPQPLPTGAHSRPQDGSETWGGFGRRGGGVVFANRGQLVCQKRHPWASSAFLRAASLPITPPPRFPKWGWVGCGQLGRRQLPALPHRVNRDYFTHEEPGALRRAGSAVGQGRARPIFEPRSCQDVQVLMVLSVSTHLLRVSS